MQFETKSDDSSAQGKSTLSWRDWWLVKHVLSEFPIIDGVCKCEKSHDIFYYSSRSTVSLLVGTTVMMANIFSLEASDPMIIKALKMAAGMGLGMASGTISHNFASLFAKEVHRHYEANQITKTPLLAQANN